MARVTAWIAFDTESAVAEGCPHLVELGAARIVDGAIVERFEALVRPRIELDALPGARDAVHGIHDADVRDAPPAAEVLARFWRWAGEDVLVAHAARSDAHVVAFEHRRAGLPLPDTRLVDSLASCRAAFPSARDHRLETLGRELGLADALPHRALADAELCARVVLAALEELAQGRALDETVRRWVLAPRARRGALTFEACAPRRVRPSAIARILDDACRERTPVELGIAAEQARIERTFVPWILFRRRARDHVEGWDLRERASALVRLDAIETARRR